MPYDCVGLSGATAMHWGGLVMNQLKFMFLQTYGIVSVRSVFVFIYSFSNPFPFTDIFLTLLYVRTSALGQPYSNWPDDYIVMLYLALTLF